jgi:hypothetical protein
MALLENYENQHVCNRIYYYLYDVYWLMTEGYSQESIRNHPIYHIPVRRDHPYSHLRLRLRHSQDVFYTRSLPEWAEYNQVWDKLNEEIIKLRTGWRSLFLEPWSMKRLKIRNYMLPRRHINKDVRSGQLAMSRLNIKPPSYSLSSEYVELQLEEDGVGVFLGALLWVRSYYKHNWCGDSGDVSQTFQLMRTWVDKIHHPDEIPHLHHFSNKDFMSKKKLLSTKIFPVPWDAFFRGRGRGDWKQKPKKKNKKIVSKTHIRGVGELEWGEHPLNGSGRGEW